MLAFVEELQEVNVEGVEPMTSVTPMAMKAHCQPHCAKIHGTASGATSRPQQAGGLQHVDDGGTSGWSAAGDDLVDTGQLVAEERQPLEHTVVVIRRRGERRGQQHD